MIVTEDSFYFWLRRIREFPELFLGEKSLTALVQFWHGYVFCKMMETHEKSTGHSATERYDEIFNSPTKPLVKSATTSHNPYERHFMNGFEAFAYSCYPNCERTTQGWAKLISKNSDSEEEAFDKFFEVLDEFLKQKGETLP